MKIENILNLNQLLYLIILFIVSTQDAIDSEKEQKFLFTVYSSNSEQTPFISYVNTPFGELLTINESNINEFDIKREKTNDYIYKNLSSVLLYEKEYLVKTCFGPNILMKITSQNDMGKKETENFEKIFPAENDFNNVAFCYSSIIQNPNQNFQDRKAIISFYCEKKGSDTNSIEEYSYKVVLFYPNSEVFSKTYSLHTDEPSYFAKVIPKFCTTFRETDIYCTINDDINQFVIKTNNIPNDNEINPTIYVVKSKLNLGNMKNIRLVSLNSEFKSSIGGYYDKFISEYHNKEKNETLISHSLYRKSLSYGLVTAFDNIELNLGAFIKESFIGYNLFNVLLPYSDEAILIYIFNNTIKITRIDYSTSQPIIQSSEENIGMGSYTAKIDEKCKYPKFMQSNYVNNYIKYNTLDQAIVNNNKEHHYIYEKDIQIVLSCSNTENGEDSEVVYTSKIINTPQCLIDLDSIHGFGIHKINFYLDIETIIYDIYADPRLKSFRNLGFILYQIEAYFAPLLFLQIKTSPNEEFFVPNANVLYLNVTHIRFERVNPNYVPFLRRPFYLYYRLMELNFNNNDNDILDRMTSNLCSFQIKFYPYNSPYGHPKNNSQDTIQENDAKEDTEQCNIDNCAVCIDNNADSCKTCDTSEISTLILDNELDSKSYNICICDPGLGFLKEPNLEYNLCMCQEDYYYYKSIELCLHKDILENGPYYNRTVDDFTHTPVYDDCYYTCKKCTNAKDENSHNCLECQDGYAYIDDDISNCYDINDLDKGYHQVDKDHFIKCHDNCVSCSDKFTEEKQFCTECKSHVPFMVKENLLDEHFNCIENKCNLNEPELLFSYNEESYQCIKNCQSGVKPYNLTNICWETCGNDYIFLDEDSKKCYTTCNENEEKRYSIIASRTCAKECSGVVSSDGTCLECDGDKTKYKNKEGVCVEIPKECLIVNINNGLCKQCSEGYYPLKEEMNEESFNCFGELEDIIKKENKTYYYFNETGKYWEQCYESCEECDSYGSENRQRCKSCKPGYHFANYFQNYYNNCNLNLSSYENCTSSQEDIYKYKDYCHMCLEGYSFAYNNHTCLKNEELKNGSFYEDKIEKKIDNNKNETIEVTIYYPCHKNCKTCKGKGDYYDNNCLECKKGYEFDIKNKNKTCLISNIDSNTDTNLETDDIDVNKENIKTEDVWFKLGEEIFYIYREKNCFFIFYKKEIILISNEKDCSSICQDWTDLIEDSTCVFKNYSTFKNMKREHFNNLTQNASKYEEEKSDLNIIKNGTENMTFHLTNFVSESPNYLSTIHIEQIEDDVKNYYNISSKDKILSMKVDIKKEKIRSRQVEYQFYHPTKLTSLNINNYKRRLDGEEEKNIKLKIDLPVDWTEDEISKIDELYEKGINAFNSSEEFYTDNCNQYTTSKKKDAYLEERKKDYYPDIELCEKGCEFDKYNPDTKKVTCDCNCKTTTENYETIEFKKNDVDKKFSKKNYLENLQSMRCISKIFKPENLKKNPGFIIMIFFLAIFIASFIFYYVFAGFIKIRTKIFETDNNNLLEIENKHIGKINDINEQKNFSSNESKENGNQIIDSKNKRKPSEESDSGKRKINYSREDDSYYGNGHVEKEDIFSLKNRNNKISGIENNINITNINKNKIKLPPIKQNTRKKDLFDNTSESSKDKSYNIERNENKSNDKNTNNNNEIIKIDNEKMKISTREKLLEQEEKENKNNLINNDGEDDASLHFNNINNNEIASNKGDRRKFNNASETSSNYEFRRRNDNIDEYCRDFDEKIEESEDKEYDIFSDKVSKANPPKKEGDLEIKPKKNKIIEYNNFENNMPYFSSDRKCFHSRDKISKINNNFENKNKPCCCVPIIKGCCSRNDIDSGKTFEKLYIDDLKKHHIICYTFINCKKDFFFLKLSFFAFSIHLYFGLNTILTFDLSMAESYFDATSAKPGFIAMNLLLPFVICGLISFIIKIIIMPKYYLERLENKLKNMKEKMNVNEGNIAENNPQEKKEEIQKKEEEEQQQQKRHKRGISNKKKEEIKEVPKIIENVLLYNKNYETKKKLLKESSYEYYLKIIIIYFILCLIIMLFNSYMMTSFCSIYRNTGVKLLVNSFISLFVSFIIPFILGLIPAFIGFLAKKTGNKALDKIYQIINFII